MNETVGLLIGFFLTIFIYSYVLRDNPLYRLAIHLLVGVSAAYAAVIITRQVILPAILPSLTQIRQDPSNTANLLLLVPLFLALLLFIKHVFPTAGWIGNSAVAFLVGVGAGVALLGAIRGTLWPQVTAVDGQNPVQGFLIALLTICTLATFQFTRRINEEETWKRPFWQRWLASIGRIVLTITFGALFAGVLNTSLILLIDRVNYYWNGLLQLLP